MQRLSMIRAALLLCALACAVCLFGCSEAVSPAAPADIPSATAGPVPTPEPTPEPTPTPAPTPTPEPTPRPTSYMGNAEADALLLQQEDVLLRRSRTNLIWLYEAPRLDAPKQNVPNLVTDRARSELIVLGEETDGDGTHDTRK